jgi:hypothetical protein
MQIEILVKCMQYTCSIVLYSPLIVSDKKMLNNDEILLLVAAGAVVHQFIAATYFIFLDGIPTLFEKRMAKKRKRE